MASSNLSLLALSLSLLLLLGSTSAQLRSNYYAGICPEAEAVVREVVRLKFIESFRTVPATIRLFFHDCFVSGCDASVMVESTPGNTTERDHPDNLSLAKDGFDTVVTAKAAVDLIPTCRNKVSCADILALATRDAIVLAGGPSYHVELGRFDGLRSTVASVEGNLPKPTFNLDQLNSLFASKGLTQTDMIALSACHTVGVSHCSQFTNRIYNFSQTNPIDPTLDKDYATELQSRCPRNPDPLVTINMDSTSPRKFDNAYFENLIRGKGLFTSDQVLFTDPRSTPNVNIWALDPIAFNNALVPALTRLGRLEVKTRTDGNIRFDCRRFN